MMIPSMIPQSGRTPYTEAESNEIIKLREELRQLKKVNDGFLDKEKQKKDGEIQASQFQKPECFLSCCCFPSLPETAFLDC